MTAYMLQGPIFPRADLASVPNSTSAPSQTSESTASASSDLGPILGGLFGGFFGLIAIVAAIWYIWRRRHDLCCRRGDATEEPPPSPMLDYKNSVRVHQSSVPPSPSPPSSPPSPPPYHYGVVGRSLSRLSSASAPVHSHRPSMHSHSRPHSQTHSLSPPPSAYTPTHSRADSGVATPLPGAGTALSPGPSIASSSRPSTPGASSALQQYRLELQQQQQQQQRVSWPRYGAPEDTAEERRSPVLRPHSERRPSRLSLTLANWNPATDGVPPVEPKVEENDEESASSSLCPAPDISGAPGGKSL